MSRETTDRYILTVVKDRAKPLFLEKEKNTSLLQIRKLSCLMARFFAVEPNSALGATLLLTVVDVDRHMCFGKT
jgi:hypothetical protein